MKPVKEYKKFDRIKDGFEARNHVKHEYYFLTNHKKHLIFFHKKMVTEIGKINISTSISDVIGLPVLQISIALKDNYPA